MRFVLFYNEVYLYRIDFLFNGIEMRSIVLNIRSLSISRVRFRSSITNPTFYETQLNPAPLRHCSSERQRTINNVFYDFVRAEEVETAWEIEKQGFGICPVLRYITILIPYNFLPLSGFPPEEADNLETLRYDNTFGPSFPAPSIFTSIQNCA